MKAQILTASGEKSGEIDLPKVFSTEIREDVVAKVLLSLVNIQPYSNYPEAGKRHSASGRIRHIRHKWRTSYGKEMSRVPRKTMSRRGYNFHWVGAETAQTRGGRRAHPPKILHFLVEKKINKKERKLALDIAIAATAKLEELKKRYSSMQNTDLKIHLPIIVKSEVLKLKSKEFFLLLKKIIHGMINIALKDKKVRAGKGKSRGRKYKENAGLLLITGKDEKNNFNVDSRRINELSVGDLARGGLGRLVIYTEQAVKEMER
jgi:large subunit ribosomal protein L4e